ncbi:MAG: hypothetical protein GY853_16680 [PVC group bacterium]|nr:hypothetical protein [PVC group bacterium]
MVNGEFNFISSVITRNKNNDIETPLFRHHLEPDLEFSHMFPKKSKNKELNRALQKQRKKWNKGYIDYYAVAYKHVTMLCSYLQLSTIIKHTTLQLIKKMMDINEKFFTLKTKGEYRILACLKIACEIREYFLPERLLISMAREQTEEYVNLLTSSVKKNINKEYALIKKELKIMISFPEKPNLISHICNELGLSQRRETELFIYYGVIRRYLNRIYKLKGYIVGLIYILYKDECDIKLTDLEQKFEVNRATIYSRKAELEKIMNYIKKREKHKNAKA